ncbi:MAG: ImmA/IrrE family metallo-endopeptidase [Rhizobiaceae bacterium]
MLKIDFEWEDPGKARGEELRATWSRLSINVGDSAVTRVTDMAQRSVRDAIYVPLYPLAEWIAQNWFFLLFEARTHAEGTPFAKRHSLTWADAGYSFPILSVQPTGQHADLLWLPKYRGNSNIEYIERGTATVDLSNLCDEFRKLLDAVSDRLEQNGIVDTRFQQDWNAINQLDQEEFEFARMAASSGFDPFDLDDTLESTIILLSELLPSETLLRFLTATKGKPLNEQAAWIDHTISQLDGLAGGLSAIPEIASKSQKLKLVQKSQAAPFEWGYDVARKLRAEFIGNNKPITSTTALAKLFGASEFDQSIILDRESRSQVKAVCVGDNSPRFKLTTRREDSDMFALARGAFDEIVAPDLRINVVADTDLDGDKASRAFAAEFLAPKIALEEHLKRAGGRVWYEDDVIEFADRYHVSEYVVRHQIENHQIGTLLQ